MTLKTFKGQAELMLIAIIAIVAIVAVFGFLVYIKAINIPFLTIGVIPINTCSTVQIPGLGSLTNMSCANQQSGGVLTSVSTNIQFSNVSGIGRASIASFVLNGAGQQILGTYTTGALLNAINGSKPLTNQTVVITAKQNYQKLSLPYTYSGQNLYLFSSTQVEFAYSYTNIPFGISCIQNAQATSTGSTYSIGCSTLFGDDGLDNYNAIQGYINVCASNNGKTYLVSVSSAVDPTFGRTLRTYYTIECLQASSSSVGQIFTAGSPQILENLTVIYNIGSTQAKFNLTNSQPESSYNNSQVTAQIYGYVPQGLNSYTGTVSPQIVIATGTGGQYIVNPQGTLTYTQVNTFNPACYSTAGLVINNVNLQVYNPVSFNNCITNQTQMVKSFLQQQLPLTNPYSNMKIIGGGSGLFAGVPYYGIVNVTSNPIYAPQLQIIAKAPIALTGVIVPIIKPKIIAPFPSPNFQSGSQQTITFNVQNNATYQGSAYIVVTLNGQTVGQTANFNLPPGTTPEQVTIGGYNNYLANIGVTWTATVYSSQQTSNNQSIQFTGTIKPNCPSGYQYQNNTNCVAQGTGNQGKCGVGYQISSTNSSKCVSVCTSIGGNLTIKTYSNGTSSASCTFGGIPQQQTNWLLIVVIITIIIAVVLIVVILATSGHHGY